VVSSRVRIHEQDFVRGRFNAPVATVQEVTWAPQPVWKLWRTQTLEPNGNQTSVQPSCGEVSASLVLTFPSPVYQKFR
jgi:hypothetical protein